MSTCHVCGEQVPADEILDHLRLFHPDEYGDGEVVPGIIGVDEDAGGSGVHLATITIIRTLTNDDTIDVVQALDSNGHDLPLTEALGMMRLAEDTLIREAMGDA